MYRGAAQRLAASPATGQAASQVLRSSLLEAAAAPDPSAAAWALRRAFDAVLGMAPPADYEPLPEGAVDFPVLDCSAGLPADVPRWQVRRWGARRNAAPEASAAALCGSPANGRAAAAGPRRGVRHEGGCAALGQCTIRQSQSPVPS